MSLITNNGNFFSVDGIFWNKEKVISISKSDDEDTISIQIDNDNNIVLKFSKSGLENGVFTYSSFVNYIVGIVGIIGTGDVVQEDSTYDDAVANGYEGTPEEFWQDILILISNQDVVTPPTDTTAPVITLIGADTLNLTVGDIYTELGATTDDGSLVVIDSTNVNTATDGSYVVTYNATDSSGNVAIQVARTVIVEAEIIAPPVENTDNDVVIGFGLTTSAIPNNFRGTHVGTTDNALFTNLGVDSGVVLAINTSNGELGRQTSGGRLYGVTDYDGTLKNDVVSRSVIFPNSGETITLSLSGTSITPNTNRTFRILSSRATSTSRPTQVTANGVIVGTYNASVDPIGEPLEFTVNTGESGNVDILIEGIDGNGFAYLNGLTLKA